MDLQQAMVVGIFALAFGLFIWGKIRHDVTAMICLMLLIVTGLIPPAEAFIGFAHPAVVTVAMILIVSKGLQNSGVIGLLGKWVMRVGDNLTLQIGVLCAFVAVASAFMNNVGALAIIMPVTIHIAHKSGHPVSKLLMPIAAASLLGGMMTLIGTPPNIIIASYRQEALNGSFSMFDFAPVGLGLVIVGVAFITFIGWRILPTRKTASSGKATFNIEEYTTEVAITADSKLLNKRLSDFYKENHLSIQIVNLIRKGQFFLAPKPQMVLKEDDILVIEAEANELKQFVEETKTTLVGRTHGADEVDGAEEVIIMEAVVMANGLIQGRTAVNIRLRNRFGINLLAVSRERKKFRSRLGNIVFKPGDVLLLQGDKGVLNEVINRMGCLPLADRGFTIEKTSKVLLGTSIFIGALILILTGLLEVQIAFTLAAIVMVLTGIVGITDLYKHVDWPVIVLLGAMLPLGTALQQTGGADLMAEQLLKVGHDFPVWFSVSVLMVITILLSNVINNAATAVLMAPIAIGIAHGLNASVDPFLMAVAVGASAAFLTPIGHQSNTLVMGPGGYEFKDYLKFGLPLTILVILIGIPLIMYFWKF